MAGRRSRWVTNKGIGYLTAPGGSYGGTKRDPCGPTTGSVLVAGSGNTIIAKLRVELGKGPVPSADPVDIRAEFAELRKILEQLRTPDWGKIGRALDDAVRS
jgi:hypothetical protein